MYEFSVQEKKQNMILNFPDFTSHALIGIMPLLPIPGTFSTKLINNIVFRGKLVKIRFTARSFSFIPLIIIINGHIFVYL